MAAKQQAANVRAAASKIHDLLERAAHLEAALVGGVDRPARVAELLVETLFESELTEDECAKRLVAFCRANELPVAALDEIGVELDDRYREDEALVVLQLSSRRRTRNKEALTALGRILVLRGDAAGVDVLQRAMIQKPAGGGDQSIVLAALSGDAENLERALAVRYKHLPALPFPEFVAKLRAVAKRG